MRAQITLEALLLFAIGVGLLLISVSAVSKLTDAQNSMHKTATTKQALNSIANYADEICVLGEGNSRTVLLAYPFVLNSGSDKKGLVVKLQNTRLVAQTKCQVQIKNSNFQKIAYLWYENQNVVISPTPHK